MRIRSALSHSAQAIAEGALISLLVVGLMAGTAFAAKGGGGGKPSGGGSLSGPVMVRDANGNGSANYMDDITFNVSTSATAVPSVGLRCYQGSNFVSDGYVGYYSSFLFNRWFTLGSSYWDPALPATCNARLFYNDNRGREVVLATNSFTVAP